MGWVTKVNGQLGVLFNPNKELMRSYHAENRFQLYYYSDAEFKKEERKDTVLTIDTRTKNDKHISKKDEMDDGDLDDDATEPALQLAIKTKWDGADIDWHGVRRHRSDAIPSVNICSLCCTAFTCYCNLHQDS